MKRHHSKLHIVEHIDLDAISDETLDEAGRRLWRTAVRSGTWDPATIDLSEDREHFEELDESLRIYFVRFFGAFHDAEQKVARIFGPWIMAAPTFWQQAFLSTQLAEEYKHTAFLIRVLDEVVGDRLIQRLPNPLHENPGRLPTLEERGVRLLASLDGAASERDLCFVEAVCHYQGISEGVQANAGYQIYNAVFGSKGLLRGVSEGMSNIQHDEGRHVAFGIKTLRHYARKDSRFADRIRGIFEDYSDVIRRRYDGKTIVLGKKEYAPPTEERGQERVMALYRRRMSDILD